MSYITENTIWPTAVAVLPEVQALIRQFYVLGDIADPEIGNKYATDIFIATGMMKGPFGPSDVYVGETEIRKSKLNAWKLFSSRRHRVKRVFVADRNGFDLMLIGEVDLGLKSGSLYTNEFTCRMVVDQASVSEGKPRLALSSVWSDTSGVMAALN